MILLQLTLDPNVYAFLLLMGVLLNAYQQILSLIKNLCIFFLVLLNTIFRLVTVVEISPQDAVAEDLLAWIQDRRETSLQYSALTVPVDEQNLHIYLTLGSNMWRLFKHRGRIGLFVKSNSGGGGSNSSGGGGGRGGGGLVGGGGGGGGGMGGGMGSRGGSNSGGGGGGGGESIKLYLLRWNRDKIKTFLKQAQGYAKKLRDKEDEKLLLVRNYNLRSQRWEFMSARYPRPLNSVYLDEKLKEDILGDIHDFYSSRDFYRRTNSPYRRGHLFYGPPGSGKSSMIMAIASHLNKPLSIINFNQDGMSDFAVNEAFRTLDRNSILVMEDIDAIFIDREDNAAMMAHHKKMGPTVSLSCVLNFLDGPQSIDGMLTFMATNYIERLDDAILRDGRCDRKWEMQLCSYDQACQMFNAFYPDADEYLKFMLKDKWPAQAYSTAKWQGHFLKYKYNAQEAINRLDDMQTIKVKEEEWNVLKKNRLSKITKQ